MAFVLKSDRLRMDEADILEKVTEWATVNSVSLSTSWPQPGAVEGDSLCGPLQVVMGGSLGEVASTVIQNVRFPLLDPEKLSQVEKENATRDYIPVS